ncbi:DNA internalization-related competence protein ComEC/Rec2 [Neisseria weaveri]|uniref:DNA internalization-related competence protein ComEC/Rec2 n=1 Tax=Neisseria weaveri TaxID=28091 RepID=UPI0002230106|nr:DNA internalization-related competence protein ComEC/Rec2 [Neisseria weaveri]EGV35572.1 DNA internalization-like competence protein ComEC/Rec2 [Neisseria weaveri ATCC 51223]
MALRFGLPFWIFGVLLSFALPVVPPLWVWTAVGCCAAVLFRRYRSLALLLLCLTAGAAYGVWRTEAALSQQWQTASAADLTVTVDDLPQREARRVRFTAVAEDEAGRQYRLVLSDYGLRDWPVGSRWQVRARVRPPVGEVNPAGFNREAWALAKGIDGLGTIGGERVLLAQGEAGRLLRMRDSVSRRWQQAAVAKPEFSDGQALMRALGIGEQTALDTGVWQAFRPLGLNHLVSISGLHVGMVALFAGWLAKLLLACLPFSLSKPRLWMVSAGVAAGIFYAGLAGFSVPTQRSVLMLAALAWAWWRGSGVSVWRGWWQALAAVLLVQPAAVLGAGFWLSFGLVAALLWVASGRLNGLGWRAVLRGQWAVSVLSVVILGAFFASVPLISPLVNAAAIPWFSWVLTPLALLGSILPWPRLHEFAAAAGEYTLRFLLWLAEYAPEYAVAEVPWPLVLLAVVAGGVLLLPKPTALRPWAALVLCGFVVYRKEPVQYGRVQMVVWDAGQGLSVLFQTAQHRLLFDTGTAPSAAMNILPALNAWGVRSLDALVLSHHDADHDGGFEAVARATRPKRLWAGQPQFYSGAESCDKGAWEWDGVHFEWLRPSEIVKADDNEQSCVLRVVAGGQAALVTGDLGKAGEKSLVEQYGGGLHSNVLVLGHHGSDTSSSGVFLNAVAPEYAVASSGYANAYRHPVKAVRDRVQAHDIVLLRTDWQGALRFELGAGGEVFGGPLRQRKPYWQKKPFDNAPY